MSVTETTLNIEVLNEKLVYKLLDNIRVDSQGCFLWQKSTFGVGGYAQICIGKTRHPGHRLSYRLFRGPVPDGLFVCHRCNVKRCINPAHLYLGTNQQNILDALADGLMPIGEKHHQSKLSASDVASMRRSYASGETVAVIADRHAVGYESARRAIVGRTWAHVPGAVSMRPSGWGSGERGARTKVTDEQVKAIRNMAQSGVRAATIASEYGLSRSHVDSIVKLRERV